MTHSSVGRRHAVLGATAASAVAVDAATKIAGVALLGGDAVEVGGLFTLHVVRNSGIAFGLGATAPSWVILTGTMVALMLVGLTVLREPHTSPMAGGLVVGGALANVADRALGGSVVDLIDLGWWPAFNAADVFIVTGIGLLLLTGFRRSDQTQGETRPVSDATESSRP
jgi:signal peptidase II